MKFSIKKVAGFTMVEIMVVITVIAILSAVVYANFGQGRAVARDNIRKTDLQNLKVAIELYKKQYGQYPDACGSTTNWAGPEAAGGHTGCEEYIEDLVPEFISSLPRDPRGESGSQGYLYRTDGVDYKLMAFQSVESQQVTSYNQDMARCPQDYNETWCDSVPEATTYAVYSPGAADW